MTDEKSEVVLTYLRLRQMIGWIGLLMPFTVRIIAYLVQHIASTESISAYYYTGTRDIFVSTLVLVGVLLAGYRTSALRDTVAAVVAGAAAVGIALFPMTPQFAAEIIRQYPATGGDNCYTIRGFLGFHFIFVATFFALAFYLVYFRFSAFTPVPPTPQKVIRNKIYKISGIAMLLSFIAIGILAAENGGRSVFWPETVAVVAFGVAWLVKGQTILKDPPQSRPVGAPRAGALVTA